MIVKPIKIEIVTSCISDLDGIFKEVRKLRESNPDETLYVAIRVGESFVGLVPTNKVIKVDVKEFLDSLSSRQLLDRKTEKSLVPKK